MLKSTLEVATWLAELIIRHWKASLQGRSPIPKQAYDHGNGPTPVGMLSTAAQTEDSQVAGLMSKTLELKLGIELKICRIGTPA